MSEYVIEYRYREAAWHFECKCIFPSDLMYLKGRVTEWQGVGPSVYWFIPQNGWLKFLSLIHCLGKLGGTVSLISNASLAGWQVVLTRYVTVLAP